MSGRISSIKPTLEMFPTSDIISKNTDGKIKLKTRARHEFSSFYGKEDGLEIRKLNMVQKHRSNQQGVQKMTLGGKRNCPTKVILLVGATGAGKTTLINAMVNFIYCVEFSDNFRLVLIDDKNASKKSQAKSQTDLITAYVFYQLPGMPFDYNYILIDTPGFGDTLGIQRDKEMMKQLEIFLKQDYGIDHVDGVGFVTPSSASRLTQTQRYVYDGLSSMFGKDIKNNIYIMATFADAKNPPVLDALKEARVDYAGFYKFNNSALYAGNNADGDTATGSESDHFDGEDSTYICKIFWAMGFRRLANFFLKLGKTTPASLFLTKEVLQERRNLELVIIGLQNQIHVGLGKLNNPNQKRDMLERLNDDLKASANYQEVVKVPQIKKIDLERGTHVTNCLKCNFTCHYPCTSSDDKDKKNCRAMMLGYCRVCPGKCFWNVHKNMQWRYEHKWIKEHRLVQELYDRYNLAQQRKLVTKRATHFIEKDVNDHAQHLRLSIRKAQQHVERLEKIALKPNPLSSKEYIDLMIESEKMQKRYNFEKRIQLLKNLKEEIAIIQVVKGNPYQATGESLLRYFQNHMVK